MLERMSEFFEKRLEGYDHHMRTEIEAAEEFYAFTAACLPRTEACQILDLGCGTGLELEEYFALHPSAEITGIDLSAGMLAALRAKFSDKAIILHCGSYFELPLGEGCFDAAVSVESLHHFTKAEKIPLYVKLHRALKTGGTFILPDYFAENDETERQCRQAFLALKQAQGITDEALYHYDTPLTVAHEIEALYEAGFSSVTILRQWGATYTVKAVW